MSNMVLGFPNRITASTLSGGSWLAALPLNNLKDIRYAVVARSSDDSTASTQFTLDLGANFPVRLFALIMHNLSTAATWKITGSQVSNFATTIFTTGFVDVYPRIGFGSVDWDDADFWEGRMTAERRSYYPSHAYVLLDASQLCRYIKVEIDDTTNSDGYVEAGRFLISPTWSPASNPAFGKVSITEETSTTVEESAGMVEYFDERPLVRIARFTVDFLSTAETFGPAFDLDRQLSVSGEAFFIFMPDESGIQIQTAFPVRCRTLGSSEAAIYGYYAKAYELKERIA